jgi:hypothetical protein
VSPVWRRHGFPGSNGPSEGPLFWVRGTHHLIEASSARRSDRQAEGERETMAIHRALRHRRRPRPRPRPAPPGGRHAPGVIAAAPRVNYIVRHGHHPDRRAAGRKAGSSPRTRPSASPPPSPTSRTSLPPSTTWRCCAAISMPYGPSSSRSWRLASLRSAISS